jgi:tetratricopeptide (TPR) repeat protein
MNRLAYAILGVFALAGAPSLRAQQINPRQPPPPPPAAATDAAPPHTDTPATSAGSSSPPAHADAKPQPIDPTVPPPPPREEDAAPETPAGPAGPAFDPLHAQRSLDVGKFYLNKGSYDAAIDRFIEASNYQPSLAAPWKMLGEAYEKKREYSKAVDAYNKYLDLLPHAPDAAKIKKTIADLQEKVLQESPKKTE